MTARGKVFNVRLSEEEWERVNRVAEQYGLSAASLFRLLLKQEERRISGATFPSFAHEVAQTAVEMDEAESEETAVAARLRAPLVSVDRVAKVRAEAKAATKAKATKRTAKGKK